MMTVKTKQPKSNYDAIGVRANARIAEREERLYNNAKKIVNEAIEEGLLEHAIEHRVAVYLKQFPYLAWIAEFSESGFRIRSELGALKYRITIHRCAVFLTWRKRRGAKGVKMLINQFKKREGIE